MIRLGSIVKLVKNDVLDEYLRETHQLRAYNKELKIIKCLPIAEAEFPYYAHYNDNDIILMAKDVVEIRTDNILLQQIYDNEIQNRG